jgi:hypothetical protein
VARADAGFRLGVDEFAADCRRLPHRQWETVISGGGFAGRGRTPDESHGESSIKRIGWLLVMTGARACLC